MAVADKGPSGVVELRALYNAAVDLGERGEFAAAVHNLLKIIGIDKYHIDAHTVMFLWSRQLPESVIQPLAQLWADSIAPGIGIDAAEEFVIEAFGDRLDRYTLFSELAIFELRRGRPQRAEEIFSVCMDDLDGQRWEIEEVESKYEKAAEAYDENPIHVEAAALFCRAAGAYLAEKTGLLIADAACGTGGLARHLRPHASKLIGLDLSAPMADQARTLYDEIVVGDMFQTLPQLGHSADVVVCCGTTYYFEDLAPFFEAAAAALKPGGLLIFSDCAAPEGRGVMVTCGGTKRFCHSPDLLRDLARQAGFTELSYEIIRCFQLPGRVWGFKR
ncbi:MAG: methyltransferase domain-containing protein [Rhodospirillaceae bacterium]|nr:methyltransferase domain-containing protein [Rhodospirillales bacterium]